MNKTERKNITDIVNKFIEINKDIRSSFDIMSSQLESKKDFKIWKKWEKGTRRTIEETKQIIEGYQDFIDFLTDSTNDWYYLNCYGLYDKKVIGFTFIISIDYDEKKDTRYCDFMNKLDEDINKKTPMLCIAGVYTLIDDTKDAIFLSDVTYADDILQLTDEWKNYDIEKIAYDKWIDVEMKYKENSELIEGYEGWYKEASIKIISITDIGSKEVAHTIIDDLIKKV